MGKGTSFIKCKEFNSAEKESQSDYMINVKVAA